MRAPFNSVGEADPLNLPLFHGRDLKLQFRRLTRSLKVLLIGLTFWFAPVLGLGWWLGRAGRQATEPIK